jgi:hypothetical protein
MARHFTVEEANEALPIVEPVLRDAVELKRAFDKAIDKLRELYRRTSGNGHGKQIPEATREAVRLQQQIEERVQFITELGILVKDLDIGLIDFPSVRNGDVILLCWRLGEPKVSFWHTEEEGYAGRRPL